MAAAPITFSPPVAPAAVPPGGAGGTAAGALPGAFAEGAADRDRLKSDRGSVNGRPT